MWINEQTKGVFVLHTDIRYECWKDGKELPGVLDDATLAANGYAIVTQVEPTYDPVTQGLVAQAPIKSEDGAWTIGYNVFALDPAIIENNKAVIENNRVRSIEEKIRRGNQDIISAIIQNDTLKIDDWKIKLAELQAKL